MDEAKTKLKMKSTDAAAKWCWANKVEIHKISKRNVVVEYEFRLAIEKPIVDRLKERHGEKWREYYDAYDSENLLNFYALEKNPERGEATTTEFNPDNFLSLISYGKS